MILDGLPNNRIVDHFIAVNKDISKSDDLAEIGDVVALGRRFFRAASTLRQ